MDRVTSPGSPLPTAGQADEGAELPPDIGAKQKEGYEYPSRPESRLSFNRPTLSACSPVAPSESDTLQVLGQKLKGEGESTQPLSFTSNISGSQETVGMDTALDIEVSANGKIDGALESAQQASKTVAAHCERPAMRKTPSVSRLCFPFKTTKQGRSTKASVASPPSPPPRPPPRHKYSCHPTLLSPMAAGRPPPKHQRHQYGQHGYSRTGLQHAKWFWAMREQEYGQVSAHAASSLAYGALVIEDLSMPRQHGSPSIDDVVGSTLKPPQLSPPIVSSVSELGTTVPPITIHPRRGDIASLRDPYSAHVDRCFMGMPAWTISKALWMHDLQVAMDQDHPAAHTLDESDTESDLETVSSSLYSSDDSDTTLVESETEESDYPVRPNVNRLRDNLLPKNVRGALYAGPSSLTVPPASKHLLNAPDTSPIEIYHTRWPSPWAPFSSPKPHASKSHNRRSPAKTKKASWPTNWYRRWEVLARLCHQDQLQAHALITISSSAMEASPLPSRTAFYQRSLSANAEDGD